jgi:hypothetical protein
VWRDWQVGDAPGVLSHIEDRVGRTPCLPRLEVGGLQRGRDRDNFLDFGLDDLEPAKRV